MRRHWKRALAALLCALALPCLALPARADAAFSNETVLSILYPDPPKVDSGYPAKLTVRAADSYVTFEGTCGVYAKLEEEELREILDRSAGAGGYSGIQGAIDDKLTVLDLTNKFAFDKENYQDVIDNLGQLTGVDNLFNLLSPITFPTGYDNILQFSNDVFNMGSGFKGLWEVIKGSTSVKDWVVPDPVTMLKDVLVNGAIISWQEYQKDKAWARDINALYQAKYRLRGFYARVNELVDEAMRDKGQWTIDIAQQVEQEQIYSYAPEYYAPAVWTADVNLTKDDGSLGNANGVYRGHFKVSFESDLREYDSNYHNILARHMNDIVLAAGGGRSMYTWYGLSQTVNRPSQNRLTLEREDLSVTLSLPAGVSRKFIELPIDAATLEQTEYVWVVDMVTVVQAVEPGVTRTTTQTVLQDSETGTDYRQDYEVMVVDGKKLETTNTDDDRLPTDIRPFMQITLVVDMLSDQYLEE